MVRLTRLRIDRFRNVKPGTDLRFGSTFNVLLGRNATGKSTLLDLIAAVTNDDLSAYAKEDAGFDLTWWLEDGETEIERHAVRTPAKPVALPGGRREEREFDDAWTIVGHRGGAEIGRLEIVGARGTWKTDGYVDVPFDTRTRLAGVGAGAHALATALGEYNKHSTRPRTGLPELFFLLSSGEAVSRFDEAVGTLDNITRSSFELWKSKTGFGGSWSPWLPMSLFLAIDTEPQAAVLVVSLDKLGSLARVPKILGFVSAELRPRVLQRTQEGEELRTSYQGFDCLFQRADGSQISHQLLSFGQKRLFSFLWYLAVREKLPVVADELLNGLHHEWIEVCFERLRERQSFLATQHPLLLDHIPIESAESVRTTFVRCAIEIGPNGREQMAWRNFDEEEAERFFVAYQTGIQHVSEVLRSEGLW